MVATRTRRCVFALWKEVHTEPRSDGNSVSGDEGKEARKSKREGGKKRALLGRRKAQRMMRMKEGEKSTSSDHL